MKSALAKTIAVTALSAAAAFGPAAASAENVLRHVPQADLKILDPVTNTAFITMQVLVHGVRSVVLDRREL